RTAAIWIFAALVCDGLDGKVARATGTTSKFGVEYDSLADLVAFGVAPGLLMYFWALKPFGRLGWLAAFLFVVCGALRLARFNVQVETVESKRFVGLPIPAAASMVAATVLFFQHTGLSSFKKPVILVLIYFLAFLMVSSVKYYSFKDPELIKKQPFGFLVLAVLLLIIIAAEPAIMMFSLFVCYILSGPIAFLFAWPRRRRLEKAIHKVNVDGGKKKE
ncbi:MAG: CDP-diacylglycerol/serine O-phosphatidyltransferase, partial [Deltaproteobacteria bacterium]|nr:CDP-diacylglycerol/serine O-phosphatidyltransferase [Deltaproteobacteria bacterium]